MSTTMYGTNSANLLRLAEKLVEAHEDTARPAKEREQIIIVREIEMVVYIHEATSPDALRAMTTIYNHVVGRQNGE